jgi:glutamate racemase
MKEVAGKIGVFDSGYGGLSVFKELLEQLPQYSYLYVGDNARAPYGARSKEIIVSYTREALEWLFKHGASLIVLACNTASGEAYEELKEEIEKKHKGKVILGVIDPVADFVKERVKLNEKIAVIGTPSTIRSGRFGKALRARGFGEVIEKATPLLASLVETGDVRGPMAEHIVANALTTLTRDGISTVILGCTHYYFLRATIEKLYPHLRLIDASDAFPSFLGLFLKEHKDLEKRLQKGARPVFYTTDSPDSFARFVEKTLDFSIEAQKIKLAS